MNIEVGQTALITVDNWFYAHDGKQYRAIFGTIKAVRTSKETLGIDVSARSQNWYVEIGCMTVAGCQIHYAMRCDACNLDKVMDWKNDPAPLEFERPCAIFNADWQVSP